jgi:uncharacterized protein (DUF4415 family)
MRKLSRTNGSKIKVMKDSDINFSDIPELTDDFFAEAKLRPDKKKQITLRLDPDVVEFFKAGGRGYQNSINVILRRYLEAHQRRQKST